jgi:hypothetical protein
MNARQQARFDMIVYKTTTDKRGKRQTDSQIEWQPKPKKKGAAPPNHVSKCSHLIANVMRNFRLASTHHRSTQTHMNPEEIESSVKDHSNQLIRLDERIKNLDGINERVTRLNNYFQICGVLLLVLGIGGGFLVSRFFDAQREIARLTAKVADSEKILSSQVEKAKTDFDSHVTSNPVVTTLQAKVTQLDTAFATADAGPNGGKISKQRQGSDDDGTDTITCPQGTYVYGIRVGFNKGSDHGIVHHIEPLYRPFLSRSNQR